MGVEEVADFASLFFLLHAREFGAVVIEEGIDLFFADADSEVLEQMIVLACHLGAIIRYNFNNSSMLLLL